MTTLLLACSISSACSPREIILSSDAADEVRHALGYVLAPTYLPKGLEFLDVHIPEIPSSTAVPYPPPPVVSLTYSSSGDELGAHVLLAMYPNTWPPYFEGPSNLQTPEDAISESTVKHRTAYVVRGMWSEEVQSALRETGEVPVDPEWDYITATSLQFALDLPGGETIGVMLAVIPNPAAWISDTELVRIAESFRFVE
jgi:hypothetical protein